jgi:uncharacterized metal-binding protein
MVSTIKKKNPIVYSCSGCSSAAQAANFIAIRLDREGVAEMSCIAGVGGGVPSLVRTAKSGREIIAIDGCPLKCTVACLARHNIQPTTHFMLGDFEVKKRIHVDFDPQEAEVIKEKIKASVLETQLYQDVP